MTTFKKFTFTFMLLFAARTAQSQIINPAPYCDPVFDNHYNMFNTIKINGTSFSFGAMGNVGNVSTYLYHNTTTFPNLVKGANTNIELNVYAVDDGEPIYFAIWIDFNHNNIFENTERLMQNSNTTMAALPTFGAAVTPITKSILIPATATTGITRMRVMRGENFAQLYTYNAAFSLDPCPVSTGNSYGCTHDFNVNISGGVPNQINDIESQDKINIYPNPVNDRLYVIDGINSNISIMSLTGEILSTTAEINDNNNIIDISRLSPGNYFIKITTNKKTIIQQFVKK